MTHPLIQVKIVLSDWKVKKSVPVVIKSDCWSSWWSIHSGSTMTVSLFCTALADCAAVLHYWSESPGPPDCFQQPSPPPVIKGELSHRFHPVLAVRKEERWLMEARLSNWECLIWIDGECVDVFIDELFGRDEKEICLSFSVLSQFLWST